VRALRRALLVAASALLVARVAAVSAELPDGETILRTLTAQSEALRAPLGDPALVARIQEHLAVLDRARGASLGGRVSPEYRENLLADAALLETAAGFLRSGNREAALAAARDAEADLAVKHAHARTGLGLSSAGGLRTVRVTVRTLRGTREEGGHLVWFVPRGWGNDARRYARFDAMSSPTSASLAPGNYLMWPGEATGGGRQPIVIGGHGQGEQTIDLGLP